jgi:hypothetical protein
LYIAELKTEQTTISRAACIKTIQENLALQPSDAAFCNKHLTQNYKLQGGQQDRT